MDTQNTSLPMETEPEELTLNLEVQPKKKPGRKWLLMTAIIAGLLVIAAIVTILLIKKTEDASKENVITIIDVERQATDFGSFGDFISNEPFGQSASVELDINDLALSVLEKQFPDLEMLGELDGLSIDTSIERNNGMVRLSLGLAHPEESMPPVDIIIDSNTQCMYISSTLFFGNYLKFDLASMMDEEFDLNIDQIMTDSSVDPELTQRYFDSFLELMAAQETKTETLAASGVSQECTVYSAEIDVEALAQLLMDYLKEIKSDNSMLGETIDSIIEEIENGLKEAEALETLYWYVYTDNSGKIIGRNIAYGDEQLLYCLQTTNGEELGIECTLTSLMFAGNGVLEDGLLDGTFILSEDDIDYLKISTENFDIDGFKAGIPNGTIELKPTDALMTDFFDIEIDLPVTLSVDFESSEDTQNITISLMEIITLSVKTAQFEPETITLPEGNEISGEDPDAFAKLLESMEIGENV